MTRRIAAAALILALVVLTGCRAVVHGKDAILAIATRAIVLTLDSSSTEDVACEEAESTPRHVTAASSILPDRASQS